MSSNVAGNAPGSPEPASLFEPRMPPVDEPGEMDAIFARAREESAGAAHGGRNVVIVTPGRMLMAVPAPAAGTMPERVVQPARALLRREGPLNVTAVSYTRLEALMADTGKVRCIPFLGHLLGFAYLGHRVVVFEGHPTAFLAGVRGADVLLVDSGMLPFLQGDWAAVAFGAMAPGGRVMVHQREGFALRPVVPAGNPEGWRYTEPDGEASYVNCLLTTLAQSPARSVEIVAGARLPDLARIATDPDELEWISSLPFDYGALDGEQVIALLVRAGKSVRTGLFRRALVLKARLARKGTFTDVSFRLLQGRTLRGRQTLRVDRL